MTGRAPTFLVVGANLTGGAAVRTLRDEGFDGRIVLVGEEFDPPYERPPLSKEVLRGERPFESALLAPPEWYEEHEIELRLGERVTELHVADRTVVLASGQGLRFDRLLLATGARNRALRVPGADLPGVLSLRTRSDAEAIRTAAAGASKAVIVGAGFIGMEVAASLWSLGLDVEVLEALSAPMLHALGPELGDVFRRIHEDHGVRLRFGDGVAAFEGDGRVERVRAVSGRAVEADVVVVGVGVRPNDDLAAEAGIDVGDGVLVDPGLRTSAEDVFAAGDVACHLHPLFGRIRVEHWDNALKQGAAAAGAMLGRREPFDDVHWFWTDQYEHELQVAGVARAWDQLVVRGSLEDRTFVAFYLQRGIVRAVAGLDRPKDVRRARPLIRAGRQVDREALRDEDVDLRRLAPAAEGGRMTGTDG
jgi:3-phenylpropionate/trans-cinnamate dioxygenase ferredoxin reductase subunit